MLTDFQSTLLYLGVFLFSTALMYVFEYKKNMIWLIIGIIPPSLISGFRFNVGADYMNYLYLFEDLKNISLYEILLSDSPYEVGFRILSKILLLISGNAQVVFGILSFMTILIILIAYKRMFSTNMIALFYAIYLFNTFPESLNIIRQSLAASICFFAIKFLYDNKIVKYIFIILFATTIHSSAVVAILFIIIKWPVILNYLRKKPSQFLGLTLILLTIIFIIIQGSLDMYISKFFNYLELGTEGGEFTNSVSLVLVIFLIINLQIKGRKEDMKTVFLIKLIPFYLLMIMLGYQSVIILRFKSILGWLPQVLIIKAISFYKEKHIIIFFILTFFLSMFLILNWLLGHGAIIPYRWK